MMGTIHALNGVVIGIIILQTSVVAPSVFRVLGEEHAGKFLRSLFPKFFVILVIDIFLQNSSLKKNKWGKVVFLIVSLVKSVFLEN